MPVSNKMLNTLMEAHGLRGERKLSPKAHPRLNAEQAKAMRKILKEQDADVQVARQQRAAAVAVIAELAAEEEEYSADDIIELVMERAGVAAAIALNLTDAQVALVFAHYARQGQAAA